MAALPKSSLRLLSQLASARTDSPLRTRRDSGDVETLLAADLAVRGQEGGLHVTGAGRAYLARAAAARGGPVDPFRAQHLSVSRTQLRVDGANKTVIVDEGESPLAWLARRKGRDGRALIEPHQWQAGERLRAEFTMAHLMPRTTSNWQAPVARDGRGGEGGRTFTDTMIAARQQVRGALDAVGPEFAGLLVDICCFLKRLDDVERERGWPPRSAKVVLQLALNQLARHYGLSGEARGRSRAKIRTWADEAVPPGYEA
jgi:hypothetical protein